MAAGAFWNSSTAEPMPPRPVLLTRPAGQIQATAALLRQNGLTVIELPLTAIVEPARPPSAQSLRFARSADWWIFTSRNAVIHAAAHLFPDRPPCIIAVGAATARAAAEAGWPVHWTPRGHSSEAMLAEAGAPKISGRVCIIGGSGGRRWLKQALTARGCEVDKLIVYRRQGLDPGRQALAEVIAQAPQLVFSSGHALRQWQHLSRKHALSDGLELPLLVASLRLCKLARSLGYAQPAQALPQMSDAALLTALTEPNR